MTTKHTPTPYWIDDDGFIAAGAGESYLTIADTHCSKYIDTDEMDANTYFIVKAANCHDELITALKAILKDYREITDEEYEDMPVVKNAIAILKKTEEQS